jgi:hypothetical protein
MEIALICSNSIENNHYSAILGRTLGMWVDIEDLMMEDSSQTQKLKRKRIQAVF